MNVRFIKSYYNKTKKDKEGRDIVQEETYPMYTFKAEKNYYSGNKADVLKQAIKDIEVMLEQLKKADKENDKNMESWDSVSK